MTWLGLQDNHSLSVRMLIRESIERLGYVDVVNKPVDQLPKRGRPAGMVDGQFEAYLEKQQPPAAVPALHAVPPAPELPAAAGDLDLDEDETGETELLGIALTLPALAPAQVLTPAPQQSAAPAASIPAPPSPEPSSSGQMEVNDIFASIR
jgi:hypothetical protein